MLGYALAVLLIQPVTPVQELRIEVFKTHREDDDLHTLRPAMNRRARNGVP